MGIGLSDCLHIERIGAFGYIHNEGSKGIQSRCHKLSAGFDLAEIVIWGPHTRLDSLMAAHTKPIIDIDHTLDRQNRYL